MPDTLDAKKTDLIEAAMDLARCEGSRGEQDFVDSRSMVFRREQDQALKRRLDQLENVHGGHAVHATVAPVAPEPMSVSAVAQPAYGRNTLLLTAIASALGGAGMTWLALDWAATSPVHPSTIVIAPAVQKTNVVTAAAMAPVASNDGKAEALDLLEGWRQAWERRDVDAYLGYYSPQFVPANGHTLAAWRKARQNKLVQGSSISVGIKDVSIDRMAADQIKVSFLQDYRAGKYEETARPKILLIQLHGKKWQITGEWQEDKKR